jgi:cytoskeletal protein RodZ
VTEVSARLRAARERAGLTIRDISASTKIRPAALEAIERSDFATLPGEFYTRAFLRAYAASVGLSPESIISEYEAEHPETRPSPRELPASAPPPARVSPPVDDSLTGPSAWSYLRAAMASPVVAISIVCILLVVTIVKTRPEPDAAPQAGAVGTSGSAGATPAPAAAAAPRPDAAQPMTMEIQAEAPIWITGAADGERVLYRLLGPGDRVTLKARDQFAFRIGNAAAFSYKINGVAGKPLGGPGEVRDVEITRENYRSFAR